MTTLLRSQGLAAACLLVATAAGAQTQTSTASTPQTAATSRPSDDSTRPATTTFFGDTGIWFVPTAEVLAHGKWSVSGYRRGTNYIQGYTNVGDFAGTFAFGVGNRAEVFGSFLFDTRIDRDVRPLFLPDPTFGGVLDRYPGVSTGWTGDHIGDFYVGAKVNLLSEADQKPAAVAIRGMIKLPTGDKTAGTTTGKADASVDLVVSKEAGRAAEWSGFAGYEVRGQPDNYTAPGGAFRWGTGIAFPSRSVVRGFGELNGFMPSRDTITLDGGTCLAIGVCPPLTSNVENLTRATFGLTAQATNGFFFGAGVSWNVPTQARDVR